MARPISQIELAVSSLTLQDTPRLILRGMALRPYFCRRSSTGGGGVWARWTESPPVVDYTPIAHYRYLTSSRSNCKVLYPLQPARMRLEARSAMFASRGVSMPQSGPVMSVGLSCTLPLCPALRASPIACLPLRRVAAHPVSSSGW